MPTLNVADLRTDFRARFPEFSAIDDAQVDVYIGDALCIFRLCERAVVHLAAHLCALAQDQSSVTGIDGGLGEVESERIGKKAVTYKTQAKDNKDVYYTSTKYGRAFIQFRNKCPSRAFTVRVY